MGDTGFNPTTLDDNHELAETCIKAITEFGPHAKVAAKSGGFIAEASAATILSQCWHRRIRLEREAPTPSPRKARAVNQGDVSALGNLIDFLGHKKGEIEDLCVNPGSIEEAIEAAARIFMALEEVVISKMETTSKEPSTPPVTPVAPEARIGESHE